MTRKFSPGSVLPDCKEAPICSKG